MPIIGQSRSDEIDEEYAPRVEQADELSPAEEAEDDVYAAAGAGPSAAIDAAMRQPHVHVLLWNPDEVRTMITGRPGEEVVLYGTIYRDGGIIRRLHASIMLPPTGVFYHTWSPKAVEGTCMLHVRAENTTGGVSPLQVAVDEFTPAGGP
jgi:hypothetical protein